MYTYSSTLDAVSGVNSNYVNGTISPRIPTTVTGACPHQRNAIVVQNATKTYVRGKTPVLKGLCMKVPHGAIYGLLGPSGCGKTTLLACILDRLRLDSGSISILGYPPGTIEAGVPGPKVGYMPQELALYPEFTIKETLQYFARLHHMSRPRTNQRIEFLVDFLNLPNSDKLISQLSGGQQRRVSLAVALLHEPALLILDEPTVGMDPLLRTSIWKYLRKVSSASNTTIIITTHYIEEARLADRVGMMRSGRLLEEGDPKNLVMKYGAASLEALFLHLCCHDDAKANKIGRDNLGYTSERHTNHNNTTTTARSNGRAITQGYSNGHRNYLNEVTSTKPNDTIPTNNFNSNFNVEPSSFRDRLDRYISPNRMAALLIKNFIKMWRNKGFILCSFILPLLQIALFCVCVGNGFRELNVAVLNADEGMYPWNFGSEFLNRIDSDLVHQINVSSKEEGYSQLKHGEVVAFIHTPDLFTKRLINKHSKTVVTDKEIAERVLAGADDNSTQIVAIVDTIVQPISTALFMELHKTYENFTGYLQELQQAIGVEDKKEPLIDILEHPQTRASFRDFMAPGVLITVTYFMASSLTVMSFIVERKEGLLVRSWVAGVHSMEVMLAHLFSQIVLMLGQITSTLFCLFIVFDIPCEGNPLYVILMALIQGLSGMTFGLLLSSIIKNETTAILLGLGTFYPMLIMSGIVWPIEGMPYEFRVIAKILPPSLACEGIREVMYRAADISHMSVLLGHVVPFASAVLYLLLAGIILWLKK